MEVSGTAFGDVTNAPKRWRWQSSHAMLKGHVNQSAAAKHPRNKSSGPSAHSTGLDTHTAQQHAFQSPTSSHSGTMRSSQSADAQRQARRLHKKRVARIVADQWKWFTKERVRMYPAIRHHRHRLMLSAFLALQRHAAHRQLEWRRAAIFNHRRQYLIQGKCLLLWHAQLAYSKRMQQMLQRARVARQQQLLTSCLTAWKGYRAYKAERRRQHLQASFYNSFVLLSGTLNQWRTAAQLSAIKHARQNKALFFWAVKQYDKALQSWVMGIKAKQESKQKKDQAISLHRQQLMLAVLRQWRETVSCVLAARQAGSHALQVTLPGISLSRAEPD